MTFGDLNDLAENAIQLAVKHIQDELGGDPDAGYFADYFFDQVPNTRAYFHSLLVEYAELELERQSGGQS